MNQSTSSSAKTEMLVGELARRAGVSTATINFYVQQQILPRPAKLNRTRAIYDQRHVDRLAIIKRLQIEQGLPLSLIRRLLQRADEDPQLLHRLAEQRGPVFAQEVVNLPNNVPRANRLQTRDELKRISGLTEDQLRQLEGMDLLHARTEDSLFDDRQIEAAKAFGRLFQLGMGEEGFRLYLEYFTLQARLSEALHRQLLTSHRADWLGQRLTGRELSELSAGIEAYLRFRAATEQFPETLQRLVEDR